MFKAFNILLILFVVGWMSNTLDIFIEKEASHRTIYNLGFHWYHQGAKPKDIIEAYESTSGNTDEQEIAIRQAIRYWKTKH